jgi:general secretion pathway protein I
MASSRATRQSGFTVIEVVVALAIVALAFGVALRDLSGALGRLGGSYHATEALALAESLLDRLGRDMPLGQGEDGGVTSDGYAWTVATQPYLPSTRSAAGPLIGYVATVTVRWRDRGNPQQVQLTTLRLAQRGQGT